MDVLYGSISDPICDKDPLDMTISKIGGQPIFMTSDGFQLPNCSQCSSQMFLAFQMYSPLENSQWHRVIYLFVCHNENCVVSALNWRVFRCQTLATCDELNHVQKESLISQPSDWNFSDDDEEEDDDIDLSAHISQMELTDQITSLAAPSKSINPAYPTQLHSANIVSLTASYLEVYSDATEQTDPTSEDDDSEEEDENTLPGAFSSSLVTLLVNLNENGTGREVVRYSLGGRAVFDHRRPESSDLICSHCSAQRTFEFQLLPRFIASLSSTCEDFKSNLDSLILNQESGICVFTCSSSCWRTEDVLVEEFAFVQRGNSSSHGGKLDH